MLKIFFQRFNELGKPIVFLTAYQERSLSNFKDELEQGVYLFEKARCLCGQSDDLLIAQRDRYALPVKTYLCKSCGLMRTNPRMQEDSLSRFYEKDYRSIYVGNQQASNEFFEAQINHGHFIFEFIKSKVDVVEGMKVYDIGCGSGGILIPFKDANLSTFGCDLGSEYLKRGRQAGLVLEQGQARVLQIHGCANLIIVSHVLEHFSNPIREIEQISELLTDNGYLYIEVPGIFKIREAYGDTLLFLQNAHLYHFTLATLNTLMAKVGFKLIKGDESIHALYQKTSTNKKVSTKHQALKIFLYLYFVEIERCFRLLILKFRKKAKDVLRRMPLLFYNKN